MYPSEAFLRERIKATGLSPREIALRAGYANITKGIRRLEEFLRQGRGGGQLAGRLPEILGFPAAALEEKLRETEAVLEREQEARDRAGYRPHLFARTERDCPSQLVLCALTGGLRWRVLELPAYFASLSPWRQERVVRGLVQRMMHKTGGGLHFFGKIRHFVLSREYDEPQEARTVYDLQGRLVPAASYADRSIHNGVLHVNFGRGWREIPPLPGF